ncbi:tetratricopeptide repeat protein [Silanimonas algicola]
MNRCPWSPLATVAAVLVLLGPAMTSLATAAPMPRDVLEALMAAEFARAGRDVEASAAHALVAARMSRDAGLAERAVEAALDADDPARAAEALGRWAELQPQSARRDALALRFHVVQGDADRAVETAVRLLADPSTLPVLVAGLEAPYPDQGVIARAVLRALRVDGRFPQRLDAWLAMAGLAQRLGDAALSAQWIDTLTQRFPADPRAGLLRAERLTQRGERDAARAEVRLVLSRGDLPSEQRRIAAEALAVLGDPEGAAAAMAAGPQDARSMTLRSTWLARAGDLEGLRLLFLEAETLASRQVVPEPALPLLLGELAERLQDWPAAERWYRRLDEGEAGDRARLRLGVVLARQSRFDDSLAALRALQSDDQADGSIRRDAFLAEADQWESRRRRQDAESALTRGLAVLEDDPALRVARARVARNAGKSADAEAELRGVLARDPRYAPALRALGALLLVRGAPGDAEPLFARAWGIEPGAPTAAAWGESLWLLGRTAEAREAWQRGRQLDPSDPVLTDTLERYGQ